MLLEILQGKSTWRYKILVINMLQKLFFIGENIAVGDGQKGAFGEMYRAGFDASRVVPVANENRPINKAVRYFIKAK